MVHYWPRGADGTDARLGLVIGRKQVKSAVGRNRIKRILRENSSPSAQRSSALDVVFRLMVKLAASMAGLWCGAQTSWPDCPRKAISKADESPAHCASAGLSVRQSPFWGALPSIPVVRSTQ